jgi:hypothetical protein
MNVRRHRANALETLMSQIGISVQIPAIAFLTLVRFTCHAMTIWHSNTCGNKHVLFTVAQLGK